MSFPFWLFVGFCLERNLSAEFKFTELTAMAAGNHRLSMDEYKQLSELLRKAESGWAPRRGNGV